MGNAAKKRLKLSSHTEIRRALNRISNLLLNNEIDPKNANAIILACNAIMCSLKAPETITEKEGSSMKSRRQFTIQQLLRAAEITTDTDRREKYLDEADRLLRQELPKSAIEEAKRHGVELEETA